MRIQHAAPRATKSIVTTTATDSPRPSPIFVSCVTIGCTMNASNMASAIGTTTARARYSAATATANAVNTQSRFIEQEQSNRYAGAGRPDGRAAEGPPGARWAASDHDRLLIELAGGVPNLAVDAAGDPAAGNGSPGRP